MASFMLFLICASRCRRVANAHFSALAFSAGTSVARDRQTIRRRPQSTMSGHPDTSTSATPNSMTAGNPSTDSLEPEPEQVLGKRPAGSDLDANTEDAPCEPSASEAGPSTLTEERKPKSAKPKKESKRAKIRDRSPRPLRGTRPEGSEHPSLAEGEERAMRLPKRPSALLLGFAGTGYSGMQVYVCYQLSCAVVVLTRFQDSQPSRPSKALSSKRLLRQVQSHRTMPMIHAR